MLRHKIGVQRGGVAAHFDLDVAGRVAGIERPEHWQEGLQECVASIQDGEVQAEFRACGCEIEDAVFGDGGAERIRITVVEAEPVAIKRIGDLEAVVSELRQLSSGGVHSAEGMRLRQPS